MILTVFGVIQFIFIQIVSAQISARDLASQNVLNYFANKPLIEYGRATRQINNPPVDFPGSGPNGLPFRDGMPFGKFPRNEPNNQKWSNDFALNNGLPNSPFNHGLPNNSPISSFDFPFPHMNIMPHNRLLPNINGNNNNGLPNFNNVPNRLPGLNNVPNGLPGLNNVPNGLPGLNNVPNGLPGLNNVPNGLPGLNNVPKGMPDLNNDPNRLPTFHNVPNGLPGLNSLPNFNNLPITNSFQNLINVPAGNILNLNNLPAANPLPNSNNVPNPNGMSSFNNLPCGNAFPSVPSLPINNGMPLNSLPSEDMLPPPNNRTPFLNNFRITEIGIGNGIAGTKRLPRDYQLDGNMSPSANLQNVREMTQQIADQVSNMNMNGFSGISNNEVSNYAQAIDRFSSVNNFRYGNGLSNFVGEDQQSNGMPDATNFQTMIPVREQRFVNDNSFVVTDQYPAITGMPNTPNTNTRLVNAINKGIISNGGQLNDILFGSNQMPVNRPETHVQNVDGNGFSVNDFEFGNVEVPDINWHYKFVGANVPPSQNLQAEGAQMFSNVPSEYQTGLTSNNVTLAQVLAKHLQMEGLANIPFLNGLPVAGITETFTVLDAPYRK